MTDNPTHTGDQLGLSEKWSDDGSDGSMEMSDNESDSLETGYYKFHDAVDANDIELLHKLIQAKEQKKLAQMQAPALTNSFADDESEGDFDEKDDDGCTALHTAILAADSPTVKILLEAGVDVMINCEATPIVHLALNVGGLAANRPFALECTKLLTQYGASATALDRLKGTVLHSCSEFGLRDCAEFLLSVDGVKDLVNQSDSIGQTPLHRACMALSGDMVDLLIANGADVNVQDVYGVTPLHLCVRRRFTAGIENLVQHGADAKIADKTGATSTNYVVQLGDKDLAKRTLAKLDAFDATELTQVKPQRVAEKEKTMLLHHDLCSKHYTCDPIITTKRVNDADRPPENVNRLKVLLNEQHGVLRSKRLEGLEWQVAPRAEMVDVLRVHEYAYVDKLRNFCAQLQDDEIGELDGDTSICGVSFEAAMRAAGSVIEGVDRVCQGTHRNVFCAVRPPGHHAGPTGVVTNERDPHGSYGFCLLSNASIAAAYARTVYRHQGVQKVAIVDFDVHHGNGTEACIQNLKPTIKRSSMETSLCDVTIKTHSYKPWLNEQDSENVLFASVHGFGKRDPRMNDNPRSFPQAGDFYPSSGENCGLVGATADSTAADAQPDVAKPQDSKPQDKEDAKLPPPATIVNYGQQTKDRIEWRASWKNHVLPELVRFNPDIIIISAGFDAHERDDINFGYLSINEHDYTWLTEELIRVANTCCDGRVVSVLEGGYRIQGKVVSPFARSVYSHVAAMVETPSTDMWDTQRIDTLYNVEKERIAAAAKDATNHEVVAEGRKRALPKRAATGTVDYAALNEELDRELERKRARVNSQASQDDANGQQSAGVDQ